MPVSKRMVIEDKEGNKLYPHTFAEVVTMNNGENLETKITNMQTSIDNSASDWGSVTGKPETFPPSTHTHDDMYYTETETNNLLNGKAPTTHTHTTSQITNLAYPVTSVAGKTGAVTLTSADVGLGNVPNYGASNSVTSASNTTLATSGAVKTAYDRAEQAFQSASSGKIAIANAITGKGVSASGSDTHATLANKIGQISTINFTRQSATSTVQLWIDHSLGILGTNKDVVLPSGYMVYTVAIVPGRYSAQASLIADKPIYIDYHKGHETLPAGTNKLYYTDSGTQQITILNPHGATITANIHTDSYVYPAIKYN